MFTLGIVGARGYTGSELIRLVAGHPDLTLAFAGSRELAGEPVPGVDNLTFEIPGPGGVAAGGLDAVVLALPDGAGRPFVEAIEESSPETVIVDISFDHRLDDAWVYGLPELGREKIAGALRIANPGCYATAMQLAIAPLVDRVEGIPAVFGVSGYSGAGATPSPKNDPERLADNLMPYNLTGHNHERESSHQLGRPIRFMPHVHPAFRGLIVTVHVPMNGVASTGELRDLFEGAYADEPLVRVQEDIPELADGTGIAGVVIGGIAVADDGRTAVVVAAEDNLLKGAAVQAIQNLNLALGLPEFTGIL